MPATMLPARSADAANAKLAVDIFNTSRRSTRMGNSAGLVTSAPLLTPRPLSRAQMLVMGAAPHPESGEIDVICERRLGSCPSIRCDEWPSNCPAKQRNDLEAFHCTVPPALRPGG